MTTANHLINALAAQDRDAANSAFESAIQERISDFLEVRKVELASTIMDDLVQEGEGMDAQRRWVRQVGAMAKAGGMKKTSIHRDELKQAARKYFQSRAPHGAEFTNQAAGFVRDARAAVKARARLRGEETIVEGGPTRKHFQQVADLLKNIPDEAKRKELAQHHAGLFKSQNPRFDHKRFFAAAGVNEDTQLDEVISGGSKPVASNQQLGRNVMTNIRRATQALNLRGVNPQVAAQGHKDFAKLVAKNPHAPGYMLLRKLAPNKAQAVQSLTQAGVPLGGALDAHPTEFNQVIQRIKRFK